MKRLPAGAWPIVRQLQAGAEPSSEPLLVSFVGSTSALGLDGETVHCLPGVAYEWVFAWRRQALVLVRPGMDVTQAIRGLFYWCNPICPTIVDVVARKAAAIVQLEPKLVMQPVRLLEA